MTKSLLKGFIVVAVVVVIVVAIICLVIFLGPEIAGPTTKAPPRSTTTPAPTVIPGVVVGDVNIKVSATLNGVVFIPEFSDPSSTEYMEFASKTEAEMMNGLQNDDMIGGFVNNVTVTILGSIVVGAEIVVSGDVATALPGTADSSSAFDVQLEVANQVSDATNDAVMQSLSNNGNLGSTDVQVVPQRG
nr:uncharacterized protein LOC129266997 [Lytechinus pictus]